MIHGNPNLDVRQTNRAIDELMKVTTNPRHRFMLEAYYRHRFLEIAGRYEEIFTPDMTVEHPVYHLEVGGNHATLHGEESVKAFYAAWAQSNQSIFYTENEQIAIADNFIASVSTMYQQTYGKTLVANGIPVDDENAYYLVRIPGMQMFWPYDDRGRLLGEDVWEPNPAERTVIKLEDFEVVTSERSGKMLAPFIRPLRSFDEAMSLQAA
ncbi:hypothetical protein QTI17_20035 [Variovorax sp. J31P179]|uniref:hypothetical protein n=1 Tax=Variovorax sp. J31P179 TaxID=3053508 RepID=UPI0025752FD9|nr:hypothetical protein [Variovorax sp. J31P179]MDM0082887.1 hypothetical protein [Variovorax sp. J31P179]